MTKTDIKRSISAYEEVLKLMNEPIKSLSLNQLIFCKYIQCENIVKTAKSLKNSGKRMPNGNIVQPTHISEILDTKPSDVHIGVVGIAQAIFKKNRSFAYKIWG